MKIGVVIGTRPDIIKLSPLIRYLENTKAEYFMIHTGQHYSYNMDKQFFEELNLPEPKYNLGIGSKSHGEMTGTMLVGIEKILVDEKPPVVLVLGDTNTTLAGVLAASKMHIKVGHIEAGLRSYDKKMPEEVNRIVADHLSDYLFTPTSVSYGNLISEGILRDKIYISGNPIVDAIQQNLPIAEKKELILDRLKIDKKNYFLVTTHRPENVDNKNILQNIFDALKMIHSEYNYDIIFPVHPRTKSCIKNFEIVVPEFVKTMDPLGYLDFIQLQNNAKLILTDSGGIQEESCVLGVPCVTLREHTERPETIDVGSNILAGTDKDRICDAVKLMVNSENSWENPYGDGTSAKKIIQYLHKKLK